MTKKRRGMVLTVLLLPSVMGMVGFVVIARRSYHLMRDTCRMLLKRISSIPALLSLLEDI
ncbi:MAG: hypothetical protein H6Q48_1143 [Deltaproteobacteria bacterium]|nr:hypothetical protein [Deltaproteobacteria bacterium]